MLAVNALRKAGWVEAVPGVGFRLEIEVREPAVKHTVTLAQLQQWAKPPGRRARGIDSGYLVAARARYGGSMDYSTVTLAR